MTDTDTDELNKESLNLCRMKMIMSWKILHLGFVRTMWRTESS